jgi:transcriptional regulator with XRE-family HTH domain
MDIRKMGCFLRELRKERGMTQEQFAETLNVSARTVSRWETGSNIPDLDTLIEIADFYSVDIRELIDGERKREEMDQQEKETLKRLRITRKKKRKCWQSE